VLGACVGYPGAVTILEDRLGVWIRPIVQVLESEGICPSHRDLDSWAVLTHHLHAGLVDQPVVFPNRLDVARLDSVRLATLAAHDPQAIRRSISKQAPFGSYQAKFRFIDLFAGIGGFRVALQAVGGSAVFSSEIESSARRTYAHNFGDVPLGDIRSTTRTKSRFRSAAHINELIPDFDVVAAGFPCQPFSLAGVSSRNHHGLNVGLSCSDQGTLFDDIMVIVRSKKRFGDGPSVLLLENVKNLYHHDSGRTFGIIKKGIEDSGYVAYTNVIDSLAVVPQRRKRLYFICIREDLDRKFGSYIFPDLSPPIPPLPLRSILERGGDLSEYQISSRLWASHRRRSRRHAERGNGFTVELADLEQPANTLVSRYYKDGKDCLISMGPGRNPRMLTPRECAKLQGFDPDIFILPPSRTAAYRAFGNAVTVPVVKRLAESIARYLK
jgi:DNA (cytosine-5)-methyltransferase 1